MIAYNKNECHVQNVNFQHNFELYKRLMQLFEGTYYNFFLRIKFSKSLNNNSDRDFTHRHINIVCLFSKNFIIILQFIQFLKKDSSVSRKLSVFYTQKIHTIYYNTNYPSSKLHCKAVKQTCYKIINPNKRKLIKKRHIIKYHILLGQSL